MANAVYMYSYTSFHTVKGVLRCDLPPLALVPARTAVAPHTCVPRGSSDAGTHHPSTKHLPPSSDACSHCFCTSRALMPATPVLSPYPRPQL